MADRIIQTETLTNICNAVRHKLDEEDAPIAISNLASKIRTIKVGDGVALMYVHVYIGDYTNDPLTLTLGSKDKYYRRIYGQ